MQILIKNACVVRKIKFFLTMFSYKNEKIYKIAKILILMLKK